MGPDFFDAAQFPTARFQAGLFKTETGFEARGPLTIRGQSVDIVLPFTLDLQGDTARVAGSVDLNRLDFGIGKTLPQEDSLAFDVTVSVSLTATRRAD